MIVPLRILVINYPLLPVMLVSPLIWNVAAAVMVAKKEVWRRQALERNVQLFSDLTKFPAASPIISLVVGTEQATLLVSKRMLDCGFHVTAIRPPAVAANACR